MRQTCRFSLFLLKLDPLDRRVLLCEFPLQRIPAALVYLLAVFCVLVVPSLAHGNVFPHGNVEGGWARCTILSRWDRMYG